MKCHDCGDEWTGEDLKSTVAHLCAKHCEVCGGVFHQGDMTVTVWGELIAHERCQIELMQSYDALDTGEPEIRIHPTGAKHQS